MKIVRAKDKESRFKDVISATFSIPRPLWGKAEGLKFYQILEKHKTLFYPDKYATWAATGGNFKKINISQEELNELWNPYWRKYHGNGNLVIEGIEADDISLGRTKAPKVEYHITPEWLEKRHLGLWHCSLSISFEKDEYFIKKMKDEPYFWNFIRDMAEYAKCDFGSIQFATAAAREEPRYFGRRYRPLFSHHSQTLSKCIDIYLVNIYGPPYIEFFGKERILSTPCHLVEKLKCGSIWLQLLPGLPRSPEDYSLWEEREKLVREHLDNNAFCDTSLPASHKRNAPKFDLSALQMPTDLLKPDVVPWR